VKLILFEKSRVELEFVFSIFTTRVRKHLGNSARFSPLIGMPNFEMPNLDSVNHSTSKEITGTMVD